MKSIRNHLCFFGCIGHINEVTLIDSSILQLHQYSNMVDPVCVDISNLKHPKVMTGTIEPNDDSSEDEEENTGDTNTALA